MNKATTSVPQKLRAGNLKAGSNPRVYFDPKEMTDLEDSIRAKGVIQPILVRPSADGHIVVAGYRRWKAACKVHGDDYEIPVYIKDMSEEEADELALIENVARANMSPAEESVAAAKILASCIGNRDEAAKRLGWSRQTFDKRLALMNCSDKVLAALTERKILLGYAELLAAAPKDRQDKVLDALLSSTNMLPIPHFRAQLESISKSLETSIFDRSECGSCVHNSSLQAEMFSESIGTGHCTNAVCFDQKTMGVLNSTKKVLEAEFPRVQIVNPGENFTVIKLVAEGVDGIGVEQASACRGCAEYGALVSNTPGKVGKVARGFCFNTTCNTQKVKARIESEKFAENSAHTASSKNLPPNSKEKSSKPATNTKAEKKEQKATVTKVQESQRIIDYRTSFWRKTIKKELLANPRDNQSVLIGVLMTCGGNHVSSSKLSSAFEKLTGSRTSISDVYQAATLVSQANDDIRAQMLSGIVLSIADNIDKRHLVEMLQFMQVDLKKHFKLNAEFLDLLTKSEMKVIAEELGLSTALGEKYTKIMGGKNAEIIKSLLAVESFDYTEKMPSVLGYDNSK